MIVKVGNVVLVLNGRYRGCRAELLQVNVDDYNCDIKILSEGPWRGKEVHGIEYEDVSRFDS